MPAGSNGSITNYSDLTAYTIPQGFMAFYVYNNGTTAGTFGGSSVPAATALIVPYIGTTYGDIDVVSSATAKLIVTAYK